LFEHRGGSVGSFGNRGEDTLQIVSESFFELFVFLSQGRKFHVEFGVVFFLFFELLSQFFFSFFTIGDGGVEASLFFFGFGDIGL
jgi:hypothetical protein